MYTELSNVGTNLGTNDEIVNGAPKTPKSKTTAFSKTPNRTPKTPTGDRFIPNRSTMDLDIGHFKLMKENNSNLSPSSPSKVHFSERLAGELFHGQLDAKVLSFKSKAPTPKEDFQNHLKVLYTSNLESVHSNSTKNIRYIPQKPERVLDAPNLVDDYYLNLVDWGKQDVLAIALSNTIYLWNAIDGTTSELMTLEGESNSITSVSWAQNGRNLAIGTNGGITQLWDTETHKLLRNLQEHLGRVGSLAWNSHICSTGSRDSTIKHHDVRIRQDVVGTLSAHEQEVCGLRWSEDGLHLASGGNDNLLCIWDIGQSNPKFSLTEHQAAVKALSWCPRQKELLASGGGSADRTIKFWNANTGALLNSIDTYSQVSSLVWSKNSSIKEIVSSHGFSQNQICIWKYPSLTKVTELRGHSQRILCMAQSPDGERIASASGDESLRFWKVFETEMKGTKSKTQRSSSILQSVMSLRILIIHPYL